MSFTSFKIDQKHIPVPTIWKNFGKKIRGVHQVKIFNFISYHVPMHGENFWRRIRGTCLCCRNFSIQWWWIRKQKWPKTNEHTAISLQKKFKIPDSSVDSVDRNRCHFTSSVGNTQVKLTLFLSHFFKFLEWMKLEFFSKIFTRHNHGRTVSGQDFSS